MQREEHPNCFSTKVSEYSYRIPSPPRIVVPPLGLDQDSSSHKTLRPQPSADFLGVDGHNATTQSAILDWSYEQRRDAQMILPHLFLGPLSVLKNEGCLRSVQQHNLEDHSIDKPTMVLGIAQRDTFHSRLVANALRKVEEQGIEAKMITVGDNQDLIQSFPHTTSMIIDHVTRHLATYGQLGQVLVCCESGNERSAGVVAAYLMETHMDVDHIKAMQLVQAQRFCVNFDDGMKRLLQGYWDILFAQRQVAESNASPANNPQYRISRKSSALLKRGLDGVESTDSFADDQSRFGGREFAPFVEDFEK